MSGVLRVDMGALRAAERRLAKAGNDLAEAGEPVADAGERALSGAGQFAGDLDAGVVTFVLSWRAVLDVFGDSASAVASLIDHTIAGTEAADRHLARAARPR